MAQLRRTFTWLIVFSIAMGFLESAVVVYLRELYYPEGFKFPLMPIDKHIITTEFWREIATIIMLLGVAILAGKITVQRFAYFLFCFALWDIFYYVFLFALIGWPPSLMTWDILFLIPIPWVGPVLTPLIMTLLMVTHSCMIVFFDLKGTKARINPGEWVALISGSLIVIISWTRDYYMYASAKHPETSLWSLISSDTLLEAPQQYIPQAFDWWVFSFGTLVISLAIASYYFRNRKQLKAAIR